MLRSTLTFRSWVGLSVLAAGVAMARRPMARGPNSERSMRPGATRNALQAPGRVAKTPDLLQRALPLDNCSSQIAETPQQARAEIWRSLPHPGLRERARCGTSLLLSLADPTALTGAETGGPHLVDSASRATEVSTLDTAALSLLLGQAPGDHSNLLRPACPRCS